MAATPRQREKVCVFIGSHRPASRRDSGADLVRALINQGVKVEGLYVRPGDRLNHQRFKGCRIHHIPAILRQPRKKILKSFSDPDRNAGWQEWLETFRRENYSLGVVYFGSWLPPDLFSAPRLGFINFHPGPLPALRGFEAETWAILSDMQSFYGTVHRVSEQYDAGEIIWRTPAVSIRRRETPASLLNRTCYAGIRHIKSLVKLMHRGEVLPVSQEMMNGVHASIQLARTRAHINWTEDSLAGIDRKNRAFNGQYIPVPLTLEFQGERRIIRNVLILKGRFGGGLGEHVGEYGKRGSFQGMPVFQALDGQVVLDLMPPGASKPDRASVFASYDDQIEDEALFRE
ncbi:methionyl-tRNA formyltransferase [Salinispira pacifica]|nr:formyltransferase family protein [Salinispira pacifica]